MEKYFAVTAPGLEPITAAELRRLGLLAPTASGKEPGGAGAEPGGGGVAFEGQRAALYRANVLLRTASRVLVRLGDFYAASFSELRKKASRLPWERYLTPGQPVALRVTCHKSRLYHSDAVAERIAGAIGDHLGQPSQRFKAGDNEEGVVQAAQGVPAEPAQSAPLVVVRLLNDHCTISIDSSGELLHRRGYRLATAKAPLRETLAAAVLLASGWDAASPLLDPFCGSGTIAIEAALMARGVPPGHARRFAFMDWPGFDFKRWDAMLEELKPTGDAPMPVIQASDRDAGAVTLAQANAERAGVAEWIEFNHRAVSSIEPPAGPGWVVTNPPYGVRVSANQDLRNLYAQFGNVLRAHCTGWQAAILCGDIKLLGQTRLRLDTSFSFINGGIPVRLGRGMVAA
jgi:putative N6-adenine-specific DNA methylase